MPDDPQIREYLDRFNKGDLWESIQSNPELLELSRLPLLLHFMVVAYQGQPSQSRQDLFDAYILRRFELPLQKPVYPVGKAPSQLQTRRYPSAVTRSFCRNGIEIDAAIASS